MEDILEFFLLGVHIKPHKTITCRELHALGDAYNATVHHFGGASGIMLGDFNAGCRYIYYKTVFIQTSHT